ncbi:MAG TPA: carbohydrate ABC transporter permease [Aggregatilineales bacterium]|nr:carbohydrate ABC transporter permease [Aggregatilineales bacterium]
MIADRKVIIVHNRFDLGPSAWKFISLGMVLGLLAVIVTAFCTPYVYLFSTSLKSPGQLSDPTGPLWPSEAATFPYQGQDLPLYYVPIGDQTRVLALLKQARTSAQFVDPDHPDAEPIQWDGRVRALSKVWLLSLHPENYINALKSLDFLRLFTNTLAMAVIGALGATASAALVAYGFTRFRIPFGELIFLLVMSTIILPPQVTIIPTFIVFQRIGWTGTLLPLIIPHFFGNAYNIFLLRQYFMGMPYELDEAAKVDGASPWQIFMQIILPNARTALMAVFLLHFLFAWNDFYDPLIYLSGNESAYVVSIGLQKFVQLHSGQINLLMAASLLVMILPLTLFFLAQRTFMQGIVLTGVEK